jgi:hypothetical protein
MPTHRRIWETAHMLRILWLSTGKALLVLHHGLPRPATEGSFLGQVLDTRTWDKADC